MSRTVGIARKAGKAEIAVPAGARIRVLRGFYEGLEMPIDEHWMVIGRGRSADLAIAEPTISRAHAAIGYDEEGFFVQDMGSTNGTRVNGDRAERARLADRDEVLLGKLLLQVLLPRGQASAGR